MRTFALLLSAFPPLVFAVGVGGVPGDLAGADDYGAPPAAVDRASRTGEKAHEGSSFDMLDRNKDGRLTPSELEAARGTRIDFEKADTNHDGSLGTDEYNRAAGATGNAAGDAPASRGTSSSGR